MKLTDFVEIDKLTFFIREKTLSTFIDVWKLPMDFLCKNRILMMRQRLKKEE